MIETELFVRFHSTIRTQRRTRKSKAHAETIVEKATRRREQSYARVEPSASRAYGLGEVELLRVVSTSLPNACTGPSAVSRYSTEPRRLAGPLFLATRSARSSQASAIKRSRVLSPSPTARFAKLSEAAASRRYSDTILIIERTSSAKAFGDMRKSKDRAVATSEGHNSSVDRARNSPIVNEKFSSNVSSLRSVVHVSPQRRTSRRKRTASARPRPLRARLELFGLAAELFGQIHEFAPRWIIPGQSPRQSQASLGFVPEITGVHCVCPLRAVR